MKITFSCSPGWRVAVALLLASAWIVFYEAAPYYSDDWGYMLTFRSSEGPGTGYWPLERIWRWFPFHWLHSNGRAANYLAMLSLSFLPKWLVSAVTGAAVAWMTVAVARVAGVWRSGRMTLGCAAIAVVTLLFPWWNDMVSVDVAFNYPVASAVVLAFILLLASPHRRSPWLMAPLGFLAGAMHEAASLPLAAALCVLWWRSRRDAAPLTWSRSRAALWGFALGCLEVASSPGIWSRLGASADPDHPLPLALLISAPLTLVALLLCFVLAFSRPGRAFLGRIFASPVGCGAAVAALGSLLFCAVSGITGRSGWFSQIYALIFLLYAGAASGVRIAGIPGAVLSVVMLALSVWSVLLPVPRLLHASADIRAMADELEKAPAGAHVILFRDLYDEHLHPLEALGRARAIESTDAFILGQIAEFYGASSLAVLPAPGAPLALDGLTLPYTLTDGSVLLASPPAMADTFPEGNALLFRPSAPSALSAMSPRLYGSPLMCIPLHTPAGRTLYRIAAPRYFFGEHPHL